uniref:Reverse transcriptase Ty1/copia-type domain-containing protein n=1 Tax=Chromera velia CCMP2878 TaxID=1169474 RepID=A0A0G4F1M5_9ALVE|eukprot:Cvel_14539.t1-p1 / transcript=Cvel_14539.t1 / gene=Cvel_14539 / organism=Chromera_velia_CCMP2878 / gene_product=hypothetical protein / transcript_product=hypothetical protein / location=Cvel_scaffold1038:39091-40746(-) / protein_length=552 / sequence_SO=supercontig / SO=protein_coding / is_pseudo=false
MVPLVSVKEVSPSRPICSALAEIDRVLQPVKLISKMRKKSAEVALMRMDPLGTWRPSEICRVEKAQIVCLFTMMNGEVSKEIMDAVQKSEIDSNGTGAALIEEVPVLVDVDVIPADFTAFLRMRETALMTMATPMKFSGGTAQRPATREEINSGIFNGALIKEWAKIFLNSVLGKKVDRDEVVAVLPLSARFIWKENGEMGEKDTNARVYSQEFKDPREMPTYAGTPSIYSIYIAIIYMLSKDFSMMKADVSGAFLQAEHICDKKIGIRVSGIRILPDFPDKKPEELSKFTDEHHKIVKKKRKELKEGEIYITDKALYGKPGSVRMFSTKAKTELKELGFEEIDESIHMRRETNANEVNAVIYHHVDDFEGGAMDIEEIFSKYGHRLSLGSLVRVVDGEAAKFVGIEQMRQGKNMSLSQASFLNSLCVDDLLPEKKRVVREEDLKVPEDDMIDLSLKPRYQSLIGTLGWAVRTEPKVQPFFSILSSRANCVSKKLMECLVLVLQALKERPFSLELRGINISTLLLYIFNNSFFFTLSKEGRQAWMHFLVDTT